MLRYCLYTLIFFGYTNYSQLAEKIWRPVPPKSEKKKVVYLNTVYIPYSSFHIVPNSNLPWFMAFSSFCFFLSIVLYFQKEVPGHFVFFWLLHIVGGIWNWGIDVVYEGAWGYHSKRVKAGLKLGFLLFIVSEVMFFFSFFWAYFHFSLSPSIWVGAQWPYFGLSHINYLGIPLLNTVLLVVSGFFVNYCQSALMMKKRWLPLMLLLISIFYGVCFLALQLYEYNHLTFSISSGVFGSVFFLLTGFHGFHVVVGVAMLSNCIWRFLKKGLFLSNSHLGLELAIYYWHFVDVVWLFLFLIIYVWQ